MTTELARAGLTFSTATGRTGFGPALPSVSFERDGDPESWRPPALDPDGRCWSARGPGGLAVELEAQDADEDDQAECGGRVVNHGTAPVVLDRFTLFSTGALHVGEDPRRWRIYRNGYQSWSGTWTIGAGEADRDMPTTFARTGAASRPSGRAPGPTASCSPADAH